LNFPKRIIPFYSGVSGEVFRNIRSTNLAFFEKVFRRYLYVT